MLFAWYAAAPQSQTESSDHAVLGCINIKNRLTLRYRLFILFYVIAVMRGVELNCLLLRYTHYSL